MALLEITEVVQPPAAGAAYLDSPTPGTSLDRTTFEVSGWAIGALEVQLWDGDFLLRTIPVNVARPDVVAVNPDAPERTGFRSLAGSLGLEPEFTLELRAVLEDGTTAKLGSISGTRRPIASGDTRFSPVLLTSLGRTGTTLLMGLLSAHPAIVADRTYPYETFPARYWLHMLRVLSEPAGPASTHPVLAHELGSIGPNPFPFGRSYVERLARFCQESIDDFYGEIAAAQRKEDADLFVEKFQPDHLPRIARDLYPRTKEIFLVRDFRDLICSVLAFNEKRGTVDFGRERVETDEEYVEWIAMGAGWLVDAWKSRAESSELVRYEDLVKRPSETVERVLAYLEVNRSAALVEELVRGAFEHPDLDGHRTTRSAEASVGRWRRDLPPGLRDAVRRSLREPLAELGYDVG